MPQHFPVFSNNDHSRISRVVRAAEAGLYDPTAIPTKPTPRQLVRVMLLGPDRPIGAEITTKGDIPYDVSFLANPTKPLPYTRAFDYVVRCVANDQQIVSRTWQLRIIDPSRDDHRLTAPIPEHATAAEVQTAINATGCPPVTVIGPGVYLLDGDVKRDWPARQWHIIWPNSDWSASTMRWESPTRLEYQPGATEVPIALYTTSDEPTPFVERAYLPYQRQFSNPAGTYCMCGIRPGKGLTIVDAECWDYVDG
ncbi:MAG: hypothetical protein U0941_30060 [Planctomycetaceae bacterium]